MKIDIVYNRLELKGLKNRTVIMIDVLRASTAITTAFANGCRSIVPVLEVEDAFRLQRENSEFLLCGERKGKKPQGFNLGNSPLDYNEENVGGRELIYTTTNGTRALLASAEAGRVLVGAFVNLQAVVNKALTIGDDITVLCAGRENTFSLEDAFCAASMVSAVNSAICRLEIEDGARWGYYAAASMKSGMVILIDLQVQNLIANTEHGKYLQSIGLQKDIAFCARQNIFDIVPQYADGVIRLK
jgi:2-phosphosulfolactate phosphatase